MSNPKKLQIRNSTIDFLTFTRQSGEIEESSVCANFAHTADSPESFEMRYEDENIWLTQKMMAALYDVDVANINYHLKKIYDDGELTKDATIRNFRIVQNEGSRQVSREIAHYNLQMIVVQDRLFESNFDRFMALEESLSNIAPSPKEHP